MIAVVDYGLGNIRSVSSALKEAGADVTIVNSGTGISKADAIVVPGVGAFAKAMANIEAMGLYEPIEKWLESGRPYLGICLGMQVLFSESHEHGVTPGFDRIRGKVIRFNDDVKIPHMGWNQVASRENSAMFEGIKSDSFFYFDHSYYTEPEDHNAAAGQTQYGAEFISAVADGNIWGVQFHPEKSSSTGLKLLENFIKNAC